MDGQHARRWHALGPPDLPDLVGLATRVLAADGGLPLAADEGFLSARFTGPEVQAIGVREGGRLSAAAAVRPASAGGAVAMAMVDPERRGQGLGAHALDWTLATARGSGPGSVETESLTAAAVALFASRGLRQVFAEDVMRFDLATPVPAVDLPPGVTLTGWTPALAERFFAVYQEAFRDRPGFPGWPAARWIEWISGDEEFRPELALLATENDGTDAAFIVCATGWITQVGVRPDRRGRRLGAGLVVAVLRRMRDGGVREAMLDVGIDNPAGRLYERLGFTVLGRRARFAPA